MSATGTGIPTSSWWSPIPSADSVASENLVDALLRLDELVLTLRGECPWDREQTHASLRRYLLEETYETLEALDARVAGDTDAADGEALDAHLCEELGDLLYQVWFQAHLASERGAFDMADVADGVRKKLVARHPHVFADVEAADADAVRANWDVIKQQEKGWSSVMDGMPATLPALLLAVKVQKRAAAAGLIPTEAEAEAAADADAGDDVFAPTTAALDELAAQPSEHALGELLLATVELGRRLRIDPEDALRSATERTRSAYRALEQNRE